MCPSIWVFRHPSWLAYELAALVTETWPLTANLRNAPYPLLAVDMYCLVFGKASGSHHSQHSREWLLWSLTNRLNRRCTAK